MKELYTSPEAELICFAPVESLAYNDGVDMKSLLNKAGATDPVSSVVEDPYENGGLDVGIGL